MLLDQIVDIGRRRRTRPENARAPDRQREIQRVAQPIREEQLRDTEEPIGRPRAEHALREQLGANHHVVLQVHASLRPAGTARGVQPEGYGVATRGLCVEIGRPVVEQIRERCHRSRRPRDITGDDDVAQEAQRLRRETLNLWEQFCADHQHARPRIIQNVLVVRWLPERVGRDGDGADFDRAEETVRERRAIEEQQHDALLGARVEPVAQCGAEPVHAFEQLRVRHTFVAAFDRHVRTAAFAHVTIHEMRRSIERLGDAECRCIDDRHRRDCTCVPGDVGAGLCAGPCVAGGHVGSPLHLPQRTHRIQPQNPQRRQQCGRHCDEQYRSRRETERQRIADRYVPHERPHDARPGARTHDADRHARASERDARQHRRLQRLARRGAERHPDAQLARALRHRVGDEAVDADRGEQQRERCERREQYGLGPLGRGGFAAHLVERPELGERQLRVDVLDRALHRGSDARLPSLGAHYPARREPRVHHPERCVAVLRRRNVRGRYRGDGAEIAPAGFLLDIADDPDNGASGAARGELPPNRILIARVATAQR